jgi:hypothetical protein
MGSEFSQEEIEAALRIVEGHYAFQARIAKLKRRLDRKTELYESALKVVRRLQGEREDFLQRVQGALWGIAMVKKGQEDGPKEEA